MAADGDSPVELLKLLGILISAVLVILAQGAARRFKGKEGEEGETEDQERGLERIAERDVHLHLVTGPAAGVVLRFQNHTPPPDRERALPAAGAPFLPGKTYFRLPV